MGADFYSAENFCTRTNQDAGADNGMAAAGFLAGATERDLVQDGDVILDDCRLADYEGSSVV